MWYCYKYKQKRHPSIRRILKEKRRIIKTLKFLKNLTDA